MRVHAQGSVAAVTIAARQRAFDAHQSKGHALTEIADRLFHHGASSPAAELIDREKLVPVLP